MLTERQELYYFAALRLHVIKRRPSATELRANRPNCRASPAFRLPLWIFPSFSLRRPALRLPWSIVVLRGDGFSCSCLSAALSKSFRSHFSLVFPIFAQMSALPHSVHAAPLSYVSIKRLRILFRSSVARERRKKLQLFHLQRFLSYFVNFLPIFRSLSRCRRRWGIADDELWAKRWRGAFRGLR